jgi:hypothetical protein
MKDIGNTINITHKKKEELKMSVKKDGKKVLLGLLLLLGIGFAAVTTVLYINGTVNITPDTADFENNVIFHSVAVDSTSATAGTTASITANEGVAGKKIVFATHGLKNIGEEVTITYDIENTSQYDAALGSFTCTKTAGDNDWNTYLDITPTNGLNGTTLVKGDGTTTGISATDTLVVRMKRSFVGTPKSYTFECTMTANAVESN